MLPLATCRQPPAHAEHVGADNALGRHSLHYFRQQQTLGGGRESQPSPPGPDAHLHSSARSFPQICCCDTTCCTEAVQLLFRHSAIYSHIANARRGAHRHQDIYICIRTGVLPSGTAPVFSRQNRRMFQSVFNLRRGLRFGAKSHAAIRRLRIGNSGGPDFHLVTVIRTATR